MRLYEVVKVFDLSGAPKDLRDSHDLAILRPRSDRDGSMVLSLRVGQYDSLCEGPIDDSSTREITYTEFQLHRWLIEQGAEEGEDVFLRWKQDQPITSIYIDRWQKSVSAQSGTVTVLRSPSHSCK